MWQAVRGLVLSAAVASSLLVNEAGAADRVLRMVPHADLKNLDPIWTTAYIARNHGYMIYDTLLATDANFKIQPQMAEGWKVSDDKLTYTFTLRDGLKWHDGAPVKAEDCVASIQRWAKRDAMGQKLMEFTDRLEVVDDKSFKLILKEPYGLVLESLGKVSSTVPFIMPKRLAETDPFKQVQEVIGSGPFIMKKDEWVPGSKVVYVKNPDYVPRKEPPSRAAGGKVVNFDRVEWIYIPDAATTLNALRAGEVDFWELPAADLLPLLEQTPEIELAIIDPYGIQGVIRPNQLQPPFNNVKARQALLYAVDQQSYLQAIAGDPKYFKVCPGWFFCGTPNETMVGTEGLLRGNKEKAKQLLKESGYKGEKVVMMQPTDFPSLNTIALVTAQLMREIGMNVEVQAMDWSTLSTRRTRKDGWNIMPTLTISEASSPVAATLIGSGGEKSAWFGWPNDPKVEELRTAYAKALDPTAQKKIVEELQLRLFETVPYINVGQWYQPTAWRKGVITDVLASSPVPFFWHMKKVGK